MEITLEFLNDKKRNLELERAKAIEFIANANGGLAMITTIVEQLEKSEKEVGA